VYIFKVTNKQQKSNWRKIGILETQTMEQFDKLIRKEFQYDLDEHLSEFYMGKAWLSAGFGEIEPDGGGEGASKLMKALGIKPGDKLEYVYDFGDSIISDVEFLDKADAEDTEYPLVIAKSKNPITKCDRCR